MAFRQPAQSAELARSRPIVEGLKKNLVAFSVFLESRGLRANSETSSPQKIPPGFGAGFETFQANRPQGDIALLGVAVVSHNTFLLEFTNEAVIKRSGQGARFF